MFGGSQAAFGYLTGSASKKQTTPDPTMSDLTRLSVRAFLSGVLALIFCLSVLPKAAEAESRPANKLGPFDILVRSMNVQSYGYRRVKDPTGSAPSRTIERFEVRNGDCVTTPGWSDCVGDRERSELRERTSVAHDGSEGWYGWWFYVPEDWPYLWPTKTYLGQFHQWRAQPVFMFLNRNGLMLDVMPYGFTTRMVELVPEGEFKGKWHKIEVQARWSKDTDGFFRVWVNDVHKFSWEGETLTADAVYFRYGVYRSFISRYLKAWDKEEAPTQTALYATVRRAATREGLKLGSVRNQQ